MGGLLRGLADTGKLVGGIFDSFSDQAVEQRDRARQEKNMVADRQFAAALDAWQNTGIQLQRAKDSHNVADVQKYSQLFATTEENLGKLMKGDKDLTGLFEQFGSRIRQHFGKPTGPPSVGAQALPPPVDQSQIFAAAAGPSATEQKTREFQDASRAIDAQAKELGLTPEQVQAYKREAFLSIQMGIKGTSAANKPLVEKGVERPGTDPATGKPYRGSWIKRTYPDQTVEYDKEAAKPSSARPTIIAGDVVNLHDAQAMVDIGRKFYDAESKDLEDPEELDIAKIAKAAPNMVLQGVELPGGIRRYVPRDINDKYVKVNGVQYVVNPSEGQRMLPGPNNPNPSGVALGPAAAPVQTISPFTGFNPATGQYSRFPGTRTQLPGGIAGRTDNPGAQIAPNLPGGANFGKPPAAGAPPPAGAQKPAPQQPGQGAIPLPPGVMPSGQVNSTMNRYTPPRLAITQIYGDRNNPNFESLSSYVDILDDPAAAKRIGNAVRLMRSGLLDAEKQGGHLGASVGPISVGTGGLGQWAMTAMGVPAKLTKAQNEEMEDVLKKMSPRELRAVNAIMATFGTVAGLRRLTSGSNAQASISTIEGEVPLIGFNTFTRDKFINQLDHLAEEVNTAAYGAPAGMIDTPWIKDRLAQMRSSGTKKDPSQMTTEELLNSLK